MEDWLLLNGIRHYDFDKLLTRRESNCALNYEKQLGMSENGVFRSPAWLDVYSSSSILDLHTVRFGIFPRFAGENLRT